MQNVNNKNESMTNLEWLIYKFFDEARTSFVRFNNEDSEIGHEEYLFLKQLVTEDPVLGMIVKHLLECNQKISSRDFAALWITFKNNQKKQS